MFKNAIMYSSISGSDGRSSSDWTSAHTNLKGKTAKKEEIHTHEKGDGCDFHPGPLSLIHPSRSSLALHAEC